MRKNRNRDIFDNLFIAGTLMILDRIPHMPGHKRPVFVFEFWRCILCVAILGIAIGCAPVNAAVVDGSRIMDQAMNENLCALTFDDGPGPYTAELLDKLAQYGIPATFFLLGRNASHYPQIVRRINAEGHEIGNHSWSHPNLRRLTTEFQEEEIGSTDNLLRSLGVTPLYIRPPYGSFDDRTIAIANKLGISVLLWSLDSRDWKRLPDNYAKVTSTRGTVYDDGALRGIFLFHDTHKATVEDLPRIIDDLRAGGCERFVTVTDYLAGILDPEPPILMSRITPAPDTADPEKNLAFGAGSGPLQFARCSRPWQPADKKEPHLPLEDAHAAAGQYPETGI